jgi:hypothetical protein
MHLLTLTFIFKWVYLKEHDLDIFQWKCKSCVFFLVIDSVEIEVFFQQGQLII